MLAPPAGPPAESAYLRPDMGALVERKRSSRKLTVKMFWVEHCEEAASTDMLSTSWARRRTSTGRATPQRSPTVSRAQGRRCK